jgi:SAM-dependent methyltransferase
MGDVPPRFWELFFELYESLPRQGPGDRASAERALALCRDLPPAPRILDVGCGTGGQTLHLVALTAGSVVAVDSHAPFVRRLERTVSERGLSGRVRPIAGDVAALGLPEASFDVVWSEGALYLLGLERALRLCRSLLRPGGSLVFTDAVWRRPDPPPHVKAGFDLDYPDMGDVSGVLGKLERCGLSFVGRFSLPDEAWWADFYAPMARRIEEMRAAHAGDAEAQAVLDRLAEEPEVHRLHSSFYAYECFVARRPR